MEILKVGRLAVGMVIVGLALSACEPRDKQYASDTQARANAHEIDKLNRTLQSSERIAADNNELERNRIYTEQQTKKDLKEIEEQYSLKKIAEKLAHDMAVTIKELATKVEIEKDRLANILALKIESNKLWKTPVIIIAVLLPFLIGFWFIVEYLKKVADREADNNQYEILLKALPGFDDGQKKLLLEDFRKHGVYTGTKPPNDDQPALEQGNGHKKQEWVGV